MLERLQQNPDEPFQFSEDSEARTIVLELGIAGRFSLNPPGVPQGQASTQAVAYGEHPTHFILVVLYLGNPDPKENGYYVLCLPKSKVSYPKFLEMGKRLLNPTGESQIAGSKMFWSSSADN